MAVFIYKTRIPLTKNKTIMKTFLFFLTMGLLSCTLCKAQNKVRDLPREKFRRHEISVSYGFLPITDGRSIAEAWIMPVASFGTYKREKTSYYGALNISYFYRFTPKLSLGIDGGITGNKGTAGSFYEPLDRQIKDNRQYLYVLPTLRYHWFRRPGFSMYSSAGVGAYFLRNDIDGEIYRKTRFAYQVNYLGIEYGKRFAVFAEFGIGNAGTILLGGRFRL